VGYRKSKHGMAKYWEDLPVQADERRDQGVSEKLNQGAKDAERKKEREYEMPNVFWRRRS